MACRFCRNAAITVLWQSGQPLLGVIAALQADNVSGLPVLLSINSHAGHGIGSALSIRVDQMADWEAFLFDQLGMHLK